MTRNFSEQENNALIARLLTSLADMTRDRDEWKQQHENLLAMYRATLSPPEQPAAAPFQPHENCNCLMCLAEKPR